MIELKDVSKIKNKKVLLKNINLKFEKGKIYNIAGENASSKSVLLKVISGIWVPTEGNIIQDNVDITKLEFFLQDYAMYSSEMELDKKEDIENNIKNNLLEIDEVKMNSLLKIFKLDKEKKTLYSKLSFGMQQKVKLIILFLKDPKIYLLDEPFNGLDKEAMAILKKIILEEKERGKTIIITSHIRKNVDIADNKVIMSNGEVIKYE